MSTLPRVAIIGGGPAAMLLAAHLDPERFRVTIYERNKAIGRKFLVAGKGGFNLTHSEAMTAFAERYTPPETLRSALTHFTNDDLRKWLSVLGISTFVGSSKKVYPLTGTKPIAVLQAILHHLAARGIQLQTEHHWTGWTENGALQFAGKAPVRADITIFAVGGGSWSVTGSDGAWLPQFAKRGIVTRPFLPANCAYAIDWPPEFRAAHEGQALKNIAIQCGDRYQLGEVVITRFGLEGNAIYALSPAIQPQLEQTKQATIFLDLKPIFTEADILQRLLAAREKTITAKLRRTLKLNDLKIDFLRTFLTKADFLSPPLLARSIKRLPLTLTATAPLDEAISTTGGIALTAVNEYFELYDLPNNYCIGEMLDWNAPTGGYLLQACFSMGVYLAGRLNEGGVQPPINKENVEH